MTEELTFAGTVWLLINFGLFNLGVLCDLGGKKISGGSNGS
jgi:hypothetical protein